MNRTLAFAALAFTTVALAQDRSITVLETSVVVSGGDWRVLPDGGCAQTVRIDPIADQRPSQERPMPAALCTSLKASSGRAAKLDQGVGNGTAP